MLKIAHYLPLRLILLLQQREILQVTLSNLIEANISQDHFKNPFSTAIDLYGNSGGSVSSGTYTIPIRNADGMYLDSSDNELYVIIRYKGDPAPISQITLSYS